MKKEMLETVTKEVLDERANQLTGQVRSRLSQARYTANKSANGHNKPQPPWVWGGGVAIAASITMMVLVWQPSSPVTTADVFAFEDMELMLSGEELELYEDLDFIAWLNEIEAAG